MSRTRYRLDHRHYRGVFRPGFFAHLSHTKFWQADNDPYRRSRRRKRRIVAIFVFAAGLGMAWILWESLRAFKLF